MTTQLAPRQSRRQAASQVSMVPTTIPPPCIHTSIGNGPSPSGQYTRTGTSTPGPAPSGPRQPRPPAPPREAAASRSPAPAQPPPHSAAAAQVPLSGQETPAPADQLAWLYPFHCNRRSCESTVVPAKAEPAPAKAGEPRQTHGSSPPVRPEPLEGRHPPLRSFSIPCRVIPALSPASFLRRQQRRHPAFPARSRGSGRGRKGRRGNPRGCPPRFTRY